MVVGCDKEAIGWVTSVLSVTMFCVFNYQFLFYSVKIKLLGTLAPSAAITSCMLTLG